MEQYTQCFFVSLNDSRCQTTDEYLIVDSG
jgi:hypothetical protein